MFIRNLAPKPLNTRGCGTQPTPTVKSSVDLYFSIAFGTFMYLSTKAVIKKKDKLASRIIAAAIVSPLWPIIWVNGFNRRMHKD